MNQSTGSALRTLLRLTLCAVALVAHGPLARGATYYDPALPYATVTGERFAVHYPPGARNLAVRILRRAQILIEEDAALLGNMPQGMIDIVLTDTQDEPNGSAQVVPKNILRLYLAAPTELTGLSNYDDWLDILLTHELAHLVDIDHTRGFTRFLRRIFGRVVAYNASTPQFLSEGVAVYAESKLSVAGRGRSSYVETLLRTSALAGTFPRLDQAHLFYAEFPYGNAAYFYGGRFHLYLSERFGEDAVAKLHAYYASQLIPLVYEPGAVHIFKRTLPELWQEFTDHERAYGLEVAARIIAQGLTPTTPLTHHGRDLTGGRYSPDGQYVVYSRHSPKDGATVRRLRLADHHERVLTRDTFSPRFAFDNRTTGFFYSQTAINHRFDAFGELYFWDSERGRRIHLHNDDAPHTSLRARHPALSPDGTLLAFVQTKLMQSYVRVGRLRRDKRHRPIGIYDVRDVLPPSGNTQYASPAYSPDGRLLAVSAWLEGGLRDLLLVDASSGALVRRVTKDKAQEGNPCFSPDGRYLLYESDADGISNLYAYRLEDGLYAKVTHLVGGAYQPDVSADGRRVLFRNAVGNGFDLHELPFVPQELAWQPYSPEAGYGSALLPHESATWAQEPLPEPASRHDEQPLVLDAAANEREGRYSPWRTLLPGPDNWSLIPEVAVVNGVGSASVTTFGQDVLGTHSWQLQLGYTLYSTLPNAAVTYINDQLLPSLALSLAQNNTPYATSRGYAMEMDAGLNAGMSWPFYRRHKVALNYLFEHRRGNALARELLALGQVGALQASYAYRFARGFGFSISPEHGRALTLSALHFSPIWGGDRHGLLLGADGRLFCNNPLWANHVLSLRVALNYALGPDKVQTFFLYGSQGASVFTKQNNRLFNLRGFLPNWGPYGAPMAGTGLVAGYAEYRLPLWHIQRGIGAWPIFFEHLHAAAFVDAGNTFGALVDVAGRTAQWNLNYALSHLWVGTGAEIRLDVLLAWNYPFTVRFGVAQGALAAGQRVIDSARPLVYFDLGTTL